jgi:proline iminopeptidase
VRISVNGVDLWFDVEGPGLVWDGREHRTRPTVVLVHGGPGSFDHSYFQPEFGRLAEVAQVIYVDLRGHGRSTWGDPREWSLADCADDIHAFCEALGIERPFVLGHSLGGPIVLLYAARHPGQAAGVVVVDGFARWDHERLVAGFTRVGGEELGEVAGRSYAGEDVTDDEDERVYEAFGPHRPDETKRAAGPQNRDLGAPGMDAVRRTDVVAHLASITSPTLVCVGERDPVTPVGAAEEIVAGLSRSLGRLHVIPDAGHFPWLDEPEAFWPPILDFVAGQGSGWASSRAPTAG